MTERQIYNCHTHTFTVKHVPQDLPTLYLHKDYKFLGFWAASLLRRPGAAKALARLVNQIPVLQRNDKIRRLLNTFVRGSAESQAEIFHGIQAQYPEGSRFVVLPMDMTNMELGPIEADIDKQHQELLKLAAAPATKGAVIPFYAADPRHSDIVERVRTALGTDGFKGVKIYPNLGYCPYHKNLLRVYKLCQKYNVPVMSHCSPHGMWKNGLTEADRVKYSHPQNYAQLLEHYPGLRLCLAHFGGGEEWRKHLVRREEYGPKPEEPWVKVIGDMIRSGDYPGLYTDISYTLFTPQLANLYVDFFDYLKVLLGHERVRERVLFGSDFYAVEREAIGEREISIALRSRLGDDLFFQIAHKNPLRYLGLTEGLSL